MAMVYIANKQSLSGNTRPASILEIASDQDIPQSYLEQIFIALRKSSLVKSVRGPGGGYLLNREASKILISDIILSVDETLKMTRCEHNSPEGCLATKARCLTHDLWEGLGNVIYNYFRSISLADICKKQILSQPYLSGAKSSQACENL